ncbi:MAG: tetratricopeptide repeat protein [Candidatus Helarchaeota archaeon]|nr:tetratricopeptide repeat protein [Candidatus Helarchaeota archaeon]
MESSSSEETLEEKAKKSMEKGEFEESIKFYEEILKKKNKPDVWNNLGTAFLNLDNFDKAVECFNKSIELDPKQFVAQNNLGVIHVQEGKFEDAISYFRKALNIKPDNPSIWENLAECYERIGNFSEANSCRMNAIRLRS